MKRVFSSLAKTSNYRPRRHHHQQHHHQSPNNSIRLLGSRSLSSNVTKKELTEKEQKENIRWAVGFLGVVICANVFTIWQEWDALQKGKDDTSKMPITTTKVSHNGAEEIDLVRDDLDKNKRKTKYPKFSY